MISHQFCINKWFRTRNADWMSRSITTCLLGQDGRAADDKNIKPGTAIAENAHFWSAASDYLSLPWKAASIRATWSPASQGFGEEAAKYQARRLLKPCSAGGSSRDWLHLSMPCLALPPLSLATAGDGDGSCTACTLAASDVVEKEVADTVWILGMLGGNTQKWASL